MPRPKTPTLSKAAVNNAKKIIKIIAPHIPVDSLTDIVVAEAAINYALEHAEILKNQLDSYKSAQAGVVQADEA